MNDSFRFSYSALTEYLDCGKRYELKRIVKFPDTPSWWFILGTAAHTLTEMFDRNGEYPSTATIEDAVFELVRKNREIEPDFNKWQRGFPDRNKSYLEMQNQTTYKVREILGRYVDWRMESDLEIVAIEERVGFEHDGLHFTGFVDRVGKLPDGRLGVVDIKTGSTVPASPAQLGFYGGTLRGDLASPRVGAYWMGKTGQLTEWVDITRFTENYVREQGRLLGQAVQGEVFMPHLGNQCKRCPVRDACFAYSGDTPVTRSNDRLNPEYHGTDSEANGAS